MWICKHYNRRRGNDIADYNFFLRLPKRRQNIILVNIYSSWATPPSGNNYIIIIPTFAFHILSLFLSFNMIFSSNIQIIIFAYSNDILYLYNI